MAHPEADEEHHDEVDRQRYCDQQNVTRRGDDVAALGGEHHDHGEQQRDQRQRIDFRDELLVIPLFALRSGTNVPGKEATCEGNPEEVLGTCWKTGNEPAEKDDLEQYIVSATIEGKKPE